MRLIRRLGAAQGLLRSGRGVVLLSTMVVAIIGATAGFTVWVQLPQGSPWYARAAEGGGFYVSPGSSQDVPSLVTVSPLHDYPLVVDIALDAALVLAGWHRQAPYIGCFALAGVLFISGLFWMLGRQFRRQAEQNARLEEAATRLREGQQTLRAYAEMSADWGPSHRSCAQDHGA